MNPQSAAGQAGRFTASVLPARAVYLVSEGSRDSVRRAIQEASTRWAGACEPIVQVSADGTITGFSRSVLENARVDGAVNVDVPDDRAEKVGASLGLDLVAIAAIDHWGTTSFTSHPAGIGLGAETVDGSNGHVIAASDSPLWQAAAAGDLSPEHEAQLGLGSLVVRRARFDYEVIEAQLWGHTLQERTTMAFGENWASPAPADSPTVICVVREDSIEDCVAFWNTRALRPLRYGTVPMYLMPEDLTGWTSWPKALHRALQRPDQFAPDVLLTTFTVDEDGLAEFARRAGLRPAPDQEVRRSSGPSDTKMRTAPYTWLPRTPIPLVGFERKYGETTEIDVPTLREHTTLRFTNPVQLKSSAVGRTLIRIAGEPFDPLPKRQAVAALINRNATWQDGAIQFTAFLMRECLLELTIPTLAAASEVLVAAQTQSHQVSEKGAIGIGLISDDVNAALAEPLVYEAVRQLTTPRADALAKKMQRLFGSQAPLTDEQKQFAAQFAGRSEQVYRSAARLGQGSADNALTALERLVQIGWAERGLETECGRCGLDRFIPLSSELATRPARCPVCGMSAGFARAGGALVVNYRLDGRIDHANDQGVVAHVLTVGCLARRYKQSWITPGVDLVFGDGLKREADLLGICDGKLVSGEVKMDGGSFTDEQIAKDIDTSARLGADLHVMAATSPIASEARSFAQGLCDEKKIELLLLDLDDLRR
jgi:hypothetical protein